MSKVGITVYENLLPVHYHTPYLSRRPNYHAREHGLTVNMNYPIPDKHASNFLKWFKKNKVIKALTYIVKTITMTTIGIPR